MAEHVLLRGTTGDTLPRFGYAHGHGLLLANIIAKE